MKRILVSLHQVYSHFLFFQTVFSVFCDVIERNTSEKVPLQSDVGFVLQVIYEAPNREDIFRVDHLNYIRDLHQKIRVRLLHNHLLHSSHGVVAVDKRLQKVLFVA